MNIDQERAHVGVTPATSLTATQLALMEIWKRMLWLDEVGVHDNSQLALMEIWKRMLWLDEVGVHDNFIELGGNSLSATRCINRIRETFGVDVPVDAFFLDPGDIASMAGLIDDTTATVR
jgi:hypothetical protein